MIMSDIYVCLAFVAATFFLWKAQENTMRDRSIAAGFVLSLFFGFISKGTIVLILPLIGLIFLLNLVQKKNLNFWKWTVIYGISTILLYFLLIYFISGDPLSRFKVIGENAYLNRCSYADQGKLILLKRITIDFLELLQRDHLLMNFLLILPAAFYLLLKRKLELKNQLHFLIISSLILLLSSNFMSISLKAYNPMCLDIRHYLFLIPISASTLAHILRHSIAEKWTRWGMILAALGGLLISGSMDNQDLYLLGIPFFITVLIYLWSYDSQLNKKILWALIPLSLLIKPIEMINGARELNYEGRRDFVMEELIKDEEEKLILTDPAQSNLGNYFNAFSNNKIRFEDFRYFDTDQIDWKQKVYYLDNWHTAHQSFITSNQIPFYLKSSIANKAIRKNEGLAIAIYEVKSFKNVKSEENLILEVKNDFEEKIDPWIQSGDYLISDPKDSTNQVSRVGEYSSTFQMDLDSLNSNSEKLYISLQTKVFSRIGTEAKLILSFENSEGSVLYESIEIDPLLRSYSNWWDIKLEKAINSEILRKSSLMKAYIWNVSKGELYMDNFRIEIYSLDN